jgi:hypothetical protein
MCFSLLFVSGIFWPEPKHVNPPVACSTIQVLFTNDPIDFLRWTFVSFASLKIGHSFGKWIGVVKQCGRILFSLPSASQVPK